MSSFAVPLVLATLVFGDLTPTAPGPGERFIAGSNCTIEWDADTSGTWTNVTIALMSGANDNMTFVAPVASSLDGTNASLSPYLWTCPQVDPYSSIYFYQFTNGNDTTDSKWTTRFTIASPSNSSVPPHYSQQSNGDPIPWGVGVLVSSYNETDSSAKFSTSNATSIASRAPHTAWSANSTTAASDPGETGGQDPAAGSSGDPEGASAIKNVKASQDHDANRDSASTSSADSDDPTGTVSVTKTRHRSHSMEAAPAQGTSTADLDSHDSADTSHGRSDSSSDPNSDGADADSDDGYDDQSTMTSLFASSSHMRKGQGTKTASPSDSSMDHANSTGTLAPTVALPSKHERIAQTPAASAPGTPSTTSSSIPCSQPTGVLDGKGGVKLANSAGRRLCAPEAPVWICGLLVAAFVL